MQLAALLQAVPGIVQQIGALDKKITAIVSDSRQVTPGALFVAYRGVGVDGRRFIPDALARGAVAVVGELSFADLPLADQGSPYAAYTYVRVTDGRAALAWLSAAWQGHPSRALALVGITGTDGKTTTANLLFSILQSAGLRAGLISTVNAVIGDQVYDTGLHTTTPDAPDIQRYLARMRDGGAQVAVLEATSHGLAQHRLTGCDFDVAVVTNITHEHLDFHRSHDAYRAAKGMLFQALAPRVDAGPEKTGLWADVAKTRVLNRDDGSYAFLSAFPTQRSITYGLTPPDRTAFRGAEDSMALALSASAIRHTPAGTEFDLEVAPIQEAAGLPQFVSRHRLTTPLIGNYNVYNVLAAAGAALALGIKPAAIQQGVAALSVIPGRMERIDRGQPFTALVDFAHTPNALLRALETGRALAGPTGRVLVVFGSAGLRDREKRGLMGQTAARLADFSVITAEDPRTEDLDAIMGEMAAPFARLGLVEGRAFLRIPDRQKAILHAVTAARPGDILLVCGKGHEQSMCFGVTEHPWRDQDALAWALDALGDSAEERPPFILPTWE